MQVLEVTSVSSKGQVVIPSEIRRQLGISSGTKLMVLTDGDSLLLKPIKAPKLSSFKDLIKRSRELAQEANLKPSDVEIAISEVRREGRG